MDITSLMPLLYNLLGGGNTNQQNTTNNNQNIPQDVLASYPTTILSSKTPQQQPKPAGDNLSQGLTPQNLLLSMLKSNLTDNTAQISQMPNLDIIKNLLPLMQNNSKKNSPSKFSELKSVDEYSFD